MTEEEKRFEAAEAQREVFRQKKGRGWSDPWDIDEMIDAGTTYESLPDFSPIHVSRISQERVQVFTRSDSSSAVIPTLSEIANLDSLPPPPGPHPSENAPVYALQRKRKQYQYIAERIQAMAAPKVKAIQRLQDWDQKQEAVDILFEDLEFALQKEEVILGRHPLFGKWVERALEEYLRSMQQKPKKDDAKSSNKDSAIEESKQVANEAAKKEEATPERKDPPSPIFMDIFNEKTDDKDVVVPRILTPLRLNPKKPSIGRMVEEWELAALKTSRRVMLRSSTRDIAAAVVDDRPARVVVHGRNGVGKSAALAAIVAAGRANNSQESIVLYLPEGDTFHRNFYYCEPNEHREGLFDLPELQKEVCSQLLEMHTKEMEGLSVSMDTMERFLTESQLKRFQKTHAGDGPFPLVDVLQYAVDNTLLAGPCYSASIDVLMTQTEKDFIVVLDEFNCYLQKSLYYHDAFDPDVRKAIPHHRMTLFQPFHDAMAINAATEEELADAPPAKPVLMQRGCLVVATTESHAVKSEVTQNFVRNAKQQQAVAKDDDAPLVVVEVPRLSQVEVEHMVANYEATGVGKLRLDKGETVMDENEMQYLRMVSGGEALKLMNACMM